MTKTSKWAPHALAALRIVAALLLIEHATQKFLRFPGPVQGVPYPLPAILLVAGLIELATGTLLVIGFKTRIAAFFASGLAAAAYFMVHAPQSFWPALNMGEPAILYCFIFFYMTFAGGGAWTLDKAIAKSSQQPSATPEAPFA